MSKNLTKYLHQTMDKKAGLEHTFHRTKIVATVGLHAILMKNYWIW